MSEGKPKDTADEPEGRGDSRTPEDSTESTSTAPPSDKQQIHAAPSAPDLDAIPVRTEPDDVSGAPTKDAMGNDRKRLVVGKTYGPTRTQQLTVLGAVIGVLLVLVVGGVIAVNELDQPPKDNAAAAPWAGPDSPQTPPINPDHLASRD